jgi:hypothetical protein
MSHQLIRVGALAARVERTARSHDLTGLLDYQRHRHPACKGQGETRAHPLPHLLGFDQTAVGRLPTADEGEPVRDQQPQQLGVDCRQDAIGLLTVPAIQLVVLWSAGSSTPLSAGV